MNQPLRNINNPSAYGARNSANRRKANKKKESKFTILSIGGCLIFTVVVVALFFIVYIIIGVTAEG